MVEIEILLGLDLSDIIPPEATIWKVGGGQHLVDGQACGDRATRMIVWARR